MKRRFGVMAMAAVLSAALAVPAYAGTWKYVNDQWKYQRGANKFAYNEWIQDKGKYYYLDNDGYVTTGWQQIEGRWYHMDSTGAMETGWFKDSDSGKWYYLYPSGVMAVNTVIDGRTIGTDGVWVPEEGAVEPSDSVDPSTQQLIQNMEGISTKGYSILTSARTGGGERWDNAVRLKGKGSHVICNTNGEYRLLYGSFGPSSSQFDSGLMARVTVYGDNDQVLYTSSDIHHNEKVTYFGVDVSGQNQIRVEVSLSKDNGYDDPVILFNGLALYK